MNETGEGCKLYISDRGCHFGIIELAFRELAWNGRHGSVKTCASMCNSSESYINAFSTVAEIKKPFFHQFDVACAHVRVGERVCMRSRVYLRACERRGGVENPCIMHLWSTSVVTRQGFVKSN